MQLWADVYAADGVTRLGAGPVQLKSASITRALDEAGSFSIDVPGTDTRASDLLQNKRRIRIFRLDPQTDTTRELCRGIIEKRSARISAGGMTRTITGPDNLAELKYKSVLLNRIYDTQTLHAVVDSLLGLVGGWTRSGTVTNEINARFDGISVLKALQNLVSQQGVHFRQSATPYTLEIGAFGTANGLRIHNAASLGNEFYTNASVLLIDSLQLVSESTDLVNWLLPVGAGRGEAAVTLEKTTRDTPYGKQQITVGGQTLYYISDAASIAAYDTIQKVGSFKDITPISTSEEAQVDAANALYDIATAWLVRNKDPYTSYSLTCRNVQSNILPGDKIHLHYVGGITDANGELVNDDDVNADFWVMEVKETYSDSGGSVNLKIASVDRYAQDTERIVFGALESININNTVVEPYFSKASIVYTYPIDSSNTVTVPLDITSATARLNSCRLRLVTRPLRSTVTTSASGGGSTATSASVGHAHIFMRLDDSPPGGSGTTKKFTIYNGTTTYWYEANTSGSNPDTFETISNGAHTHDVTIPAHTHAMTYGLYQDNTYPDTVSITIDGTDYTSALGGPWGVGGVAVNEVLEIGNQINQSSLQQLHQIVFSCTGGKGEIEVTLTPWETVQSVASF